MTDHRSLAAIMADVVKHGQDNPKHGTNCSCMDKYIREIRAQVHGAIPVPREDETVGQVSTRLDARWRMSHVLTAVVSRL